MVLRLGLMLLFGCSKQDPVPGVRSTDTASGPGIALDLLFEDRLLLTEVLGDCIDAVGVDAHQHLCTTVDGTLLHDERDGADIPLGDFSTLAAARRPDGTLVLALDGALYTFDGQTLTAIAAPIPSPIDELRRHGDTLWLWGTGRLFRWTGDAVSEVSLPEYSTLYDFAVAGDRLYLGVPWLVEAEITADGIEVLGVEDTIASSMQTDGAGNLWYVSDARVYMKRPGESARQVDLPEDIISVTGPAVWIQGVEYTYRYRETTLSQHDFATDGWLGVDGYGRLLQLIGGQLVRHSIDRPVVVTGLPESIFVQETARLLPSDPESLTQLRVWVDSTPLSVEFDPLSVVVDPEGLEQGPHTLRFYSESELGDRQDEFPIWIGELPQVSWTEIEGLSQEHCIRCHGGATLTDLSTQAGWELRIDAIIDQVSTQGMPLGGPYLSEDEIVSIRGWKQGGFQ